MRIRAHRNFKRAMIRAKGPFVDEAALAAAQLQVEGAIDAAETKLALFVTNHEADIVAERRDFALLADCFEWINGRKPGETPGGP